MNRSKMAYFLMAYIFVWYTGAILAINYLGAGPLETLGIGTVGGVFVAAFKDMWQFFWRKPSPKEKEHENPK